MDQQSAARAALGRAIDDVRLATHRVQAAQGVDWVSVLAARYRQELHEAIVELRRFEAELEELRRALT